jgi:hypothetical protein
MAAEQAQTPINCPACGAESPAGRRFCWVCHSALERSSEDPNQVAGRAAPVEGHRFRLGTIMVGIALLAIWFGLLRESPYLAVLLTVLVILALTVTQARISDRSLDGVRLNFQQKTILFVWSFALVAGWLLLCALVIGMVVVGLVILFKEACGRVFGL